MYWQIGKVILEEEQQGKERADYGAYLIKSLAEALEPQFGNGFSFRQLNLFPQFYRSFPIVNALRSQSGGQDLETPGKRLSCIRDCGRYNLCHIRGRDPPLVLVSGAYRNRHGPCRAATPRQSHLRSRYLLSR